jgi:hypothetical protein
METSKKASNEPSKKTKRETRKNINGLSIKSLRNKGIINRCMRYTKKFRSNSLLYTISEDDSNESNELFHPKLSQKNDKLSLLKSKINKKSMKTNH